MFRDARQPPADIVGYDPMRGADAYWFDQEAAEKVVQFFYRCLKLTSGANAGEPFRLEPWQQDILRTLFGWKRQDGRRRYRTAYIQIPRKNGKTALAAGLANYVLFCDAEPEAQCYCCASSADQATLVFSQAAAMIRKDEGLESACKITAARKHITYKDSFMRAIPANEGTSHGFNSHLIIGDELHAWPKREFFNVMHTSTAARMQPLEVYITTAGYDRQSVCYDLYKYACRVRDGHKDDPTFLPVIYETLESEDWTDPAIWKKANPNLGVSVPLDYMQNECQRAKDSPHLENAFRRLHLNQWTSQDTRWLQMHRWRECKNGDDFVPGVSVFGGLDLSSVTDLTSWSMVQPTENGWRVRTHSFIPAGRVHEAELRDNVPYRRWIKDGWMTETPGDTIDYEYIDRRVISDCRKYGVSSIAYDRYNANQTRTTIENGGIEIFEFPQTFLFFNAPCKELERCVIEGSLQHGGDPVLEWCAENVEVRTDPNGNIRPVKPSHANSTRRIDPMVATIMAIGAGLIKGVQPPSIYEQEGQLSL